MTALRTGFLVVITLASAVLAGCGGATGTQVAENGDPASSSGGGSPPPDSTGVTPAPTTAPTTTPPEAAADPTKDGPLAIAELDATTKVAATGDSVPLHVAYPGAAAGPFPVIVVAHGFQLPSSQYYGYVKRLASFGYVAIAADYPAGFTSVNNLRDAKNLSGALDWAASAKELAGKASVAKSGVMGHSRGGKAAILAASMDTRFAAVLGLDPVDTKPPLACDATTECPDSRAAIAKRSLPSLFLGETTDSTGGGFGQACAPADGNYATYHATAPSPSIEVTVAGANHMSFLDDPTTCGFACSACKPATADHAKVIALARSMSVAFFQRHLRGDAAYQTYLDGPQAKTLWGASGLATIRSK